MANGDLNNPGNDPGRRSFQILRRLLQDDLDFPSCPPEQAANQQLLWRLELNGVISRDERLLLARLVHLVWELENAWDDRLTVEENPTYEEIEADIATLCQRHQQNDLHPIARAILSLVRSWLDGFDAPADDLEQEIIQAIDRPNNRPLSLVLTAALTGASSSLANQANPLTDAINEVALHLRDLFKTAALTVRAQCIARAVAILVESGLSFYVSRFLDGFCAPELRDARDKFRQPGHGLISDYCNCRQDITENAPPRMTYGVLRSELSGTSRLRPYEEVNGGDYFNLEEGFFSFRDPRHERLDSNRLLDLLFTSVKRSLELPEELNARDLELIEQIKRAIRIHFLPCESFSARACLMNRNLQAKLLQLQFEQSGFTDGICCEWKDTSMTVKVNYQPLIWVSIRDDVRETEELIEIVLPELSTKLQARGMNLQSGIPTPFPDLPSANPISFDDEYPNEEQAHAVSQYVDTVIAAIEAWKENPNFPRLVRGVQDGAVGPLRRRYHMTFEYEIDAAWVGTSEDGTMHCFRDGQGHNVWLHADRMRPDDPPGEAPIPEIWQ